jgi:hypothetical protein
MAENEPRYHVSKERHPLGLAFIVYNREIAGEITEAGYGVAGFETEQAAREYASWKNHSDDSILKLAAEYDKMRQAIYLILSYEQRVHVLPEEMHLLNIIKQDIRKITEIT